jgi:hypothetical protein
MAPALDAAVMDRKVPAGLPTVRADASPAPAPQPNGHDHPLDGEADVNDRCPVKPEQPLECGAVRTSSSCVSRLPSTASSLPGRTAARRHNVRNIHSGW